MSRSAKATENSALDALNGKFPENPDLSMYTRVYEKGISEIRNLRGELKEAHDEHDTAVTLQKEASDKEEKKLLTKEVKAKTSKVCEVKAKLDKTVVKTHTACAQTALKMHDATAARLDLVTQCLIEINKRARDGLHSIAEGKDPRVILEAIQRAADSASDWSCQYVGFMEDNRGPVVALRLNAERDAGVMEVEADKEDAAGAGAGPGLAVDQPVTDASPEPKRRKLDACSVTISLVSDSDEGQVEYAGAGGAGGA